MAPVEWIRGKDPVLSIYNNNDELVEEVKLTELNDMEELHKMMQEKGFTRKSPKDLEAAREEMKIKDAKAAEAAAEDSRIKREAAKKRQEERKAKLAAEKEAEAASAAAEEETPASKEGEL